MKTTNINVYNIKLTARLNLYMNSFVVFVANHTCAVFATKMMCFIYYQSYMCVILKYIYSHMRICVHDEYIAFSF